MSDVKIIIRSYKRSDKIRSMTIKELMKQKDLDLSESLYIVVADKEEMNLYKEALKDVPVKDFIISGVGANTATNKAIEYFPEGEKLIFMDDDLKNLKFSRDLQNRAKPENLDFLSEVFSFGFDELLVHGISSFTFDFTTNALFKQGKPFFEIKTRRLCGAWWGMYNDKKALTNLSHNDDNARSIHFLNKDNAIGCFNFVYVTADYGNMEGGMQSSGDRGSNDNRKNITLKSCEECSTIEGYDKFYRKEFFFNEKANCYDIKFKTKRMFIKNGLDFVDLRYNSFLSNSYEDKSCLHEEVIRL